jgi:hypothetical protein
MSWGRKRRVSRAGATRRQLADAFSWLTDGLRSRLRVRIHLAPPPSPQHQRFSRTIGETRVCAPFNADSIHNGIGPLVSDVSGPSSVEHQHTARDLSGFHRAERFVYILEFHTLADHVVEVEMALQVKFDVARHIDAEAVP